MSHFSKKKRKIKNKDFLLEALNKLDYNITDKNSVMGYQENTISAEIVIGLPGTNYDIGFEKNSDGYYELVADWYGIQNKNSSNVIDRIENEIEDIENKIKQEYAYSTTIKKLEEQGFSIDEEARENGEIRIQLTRVQ